MGLVFGGAFRDAFWQLFGGLLGALGTPLGDFGSTLAALGVALETFVGLWASWVDLERNWTVSGESLTRSST